ncbi:GlsB/YeaQ/YmgE family stress response membrane protein [Actinosynnema sp. NPDC053489]|uniref:GlsB/YeaQ/YmgE family stress response membrane protein n=1 Tax=Actinosynnema sp. NPDC053489 TaxID=3363916 RepID=UPI0037CC18DD
MGIGGVISALIVGLVIGLLGRLVAPGKQSIPIWLTIIVGIVAAFIGTFIARALGVEDTPGIDWIEIIVQVVLAAIGVSLAAGFYGRRSVR